MVDINKYLNKLERIQNEKQTGHIMVMSKIVKDLSSGIYSSPANCIKELINNSFDADATKVIVRAKPSLDLFSITDNGEGMSLEEYRDEFSVISKSFKRIDNDRTEKYDRPIIGKIGIGFIAVSEICDKLIIITKKKGDIGRIKTEIDFKKFKNLDFNSNDEFYKKSEFDLWYEEKPEEKEDQYTKVILNELTSDFKKILSDKDNVVLDKPISKELENKTFEEIIDYFKNKELITYGELGEYWKLVIDLAKTIPIEYLDNGPVKMDKSESVIETIKNELKSYNFKVDFDGLILKKPILFPNEDKFEDYEFDYIVHSFKENKEFNGSKLSFKGYFYSQHGAINPKEDAGIIIRIRNVKVGDVDSSYLGYPFVSNMIFRHWNFGEIYIDEGLEDAMNIDRNSFRITHIHYRELKKFVHSYLNDIIFPHCLDGFYRAKKKKREKERIKKHQKKITNAVKTNLKQFRKKATIEIIEEKVGVPIEINQSDSKVIIRSKTPIFYSFSKTEKEIVQEIMVLFEAAYEKAKKKNEGIKELKKYFYESLEKREK